MGLRLASLTGQRLLVDSAPGASTGSWHRGASAASWGAAAGRTRRTELLSCHVARATPSIYRCALQQMSCVWDGCSCRIHLGNPLRSALLLKTKGQCLIFAEANLNQVALSDNKNSGQGRTLKIWNINRADKNNKDMVWRGQGKRSMSIYVA